MAGEKDDEKDDFFGMSDDDFAQVSPADEGTSAPSSTSDNEPVIEATTVPETVEKTAEETAAEETANNDIGDDNPSSLGSDADKSADTTKEEGVDKNALDKPDGEEGDTPKPTDKPKTDAEKQAETDAKKAAEAKPKEPATPEAKAEPAKVVVQSVPQSKDMSQEQLASFYDTIMKPIKANGKDIQLRSPEEVIRLLQMGAGYGKKIQDMQPHVKTLRMLEKNNLLDESRLSFLIDLDKKNPDAIKKLLKDSGIDPLDLNIEDNANYKPTNHSVSDTEVDFVSTMKEVKALPGGLETIQHVNTAWDQKSKDFLWDNPGVLTAINEQRQTGIYGVITAEIDRQKMLGDIPPNMPFLEAYKIAGDALVQAKQLAQPGGGQELKPQDKVVTPPAQERVTQPETKVLGTRTATPKSQATNGDKAKAAASPQAASRKAKQVTNPLDMADDAFLKEFQLG